VLAGVLQIVRLNNGISERILWILAG